MHLQSIIKLHCFWVMLPSSTNLLLHNSVKQAKNAGGCLTESPLPACANPGTEKAPATHVTTCTQTSLAALKGCNQTLFVMQIP